MVSNIVQEALVELLAGFLAYFYESLVYWLSRTLIDNGDYIRADVQFTTFLTFNLIRIT